MRSAMGRTTATLVLGAGLIMTATLEAGEPPGERFTGLLGFRLAKSTLADVQRRFGGQLQESGDAGDYEARLCYVERAGGIMVAFSSGELGGSEHELLGFELSSSSTEGSDSCLLLDDRHVQPAKFQVGGLRLGMGREEFARALGGIEKQEPWGVGRLFQRRVPMTPAERAATQSSPGYDQWDVFITVAGEFKGGVLVRLAVWKTVTS
jgi:hypothetical protein